MHNLNILLPNRPTYMSTLDKYIITETKQAWNEKLVCNMEKQESHFLIKAGVKNQASNLDIKALDNLTFLISFKSLSIWLTIN